jgi:hypothetical protein
MGHLLGELEDILPEAETKGQKSFHHDKPSTGRLDLKGPERMNETGGRLGSANDGTTEINA